ncbi:MAG TPA: M1 family aminopeptidase [Terriglobales bacterium]|nr:M1 family aminopeptidase [Terriglobales bacterium]
MTKVLLLLLLAAGERLCAQSAAGTQPAPAGKAVTLYRQILSADLDPAEVHAIRQVSLEREDVHISLNDGTIGLMKATDGHITGAVFEGVGEILLIAPDRAERTSLGLFTGSPVLEQRFGSAYFRFADDTVTRDLRAGFRPLPPDQNAAEFIARWQRPAAELARSDGLQLLQALSNSADAASRYLHLRVGGTQLGIFDLFLDTNSQEQISVAQPKIVGNSSYYDIWTSFPMRSVRRAGTAGEHLAPRFDLSDYRIRAKVEPPSDMEAEAEATLVPRRSGQRAVILELSRYLHISEVLMNGKAIEFIQNEAISGSDLARRGDDLIEIVFPQPLQAGEHARLTFKYAGPVMLDEGNGLVYIGSRGTWYPNAGPEFSDFDLTFDYPEDWSLIATGKQVSTSHQSGRTVTRFVSSKAISRAGFNMGHFAVGRASSNGVSIRAYASKTVEPQLFARETLAGERPDPAREVQQIASQTAEAVTFLSGELDPFPYPNLEVTQLPGVLSQSWPGLIYLSSMAFLDREERRAAGISDPYLELLLSRMMLVHEAGHQWWGDAVDSLYYRDEWIIEALANYCALMMLEKNDPKAPEIALDYYREQLLKPGNSGIIADAGPVTLGARLTSSRFPDAYQKVLYGRGTWLIHMLRTMLREASGGKNDALFFSALRSLLAKSPNRKISTHDLQLAFEQVMPASLEYEKKRSLEWFFDSWVNGASVPRLRLEQVKMSPAGGKVRVSGTIRQTECAKDLVTAVPIYAVDGAGRTHLLAFVFADDVETAFKLTAPAGTKQLLMDPANTILRR